MEGIFSGCSSLIYLDLSSFDTSSVTFEDGLFDGCEKLEYVNFKIATNQPDLNRIYHHAKLDKLTIWSEDENWKNAYGLTYKTYINCANNIYFLKLNETEHMMKCFKKTKDLNNPC